MSRNKREVMKKVVIQAGILCVAVCMIVYGISRGESAIILNKAVNICLECIGLG